MTPPATVPGILRPSSAERWGDPDGPCAGSFALEQRYPEDEDSPEARAGTAAHFYVTEAVQGRIWPVGTLAPNGHPIDEEMVQEGRSFIEDVQRQAATVHPDAPPHVRVETRLQMHGLVHPECEGTPDAYMLDLAGKQLIVWDYKYGHGYVEPYRNPQMMLYAAGVFEAYELTRDDVADLRVSLRVFQPRNYNAPGPVRTWDTTGPVIWAETERLFHAAHAAKQPGAPTQTGDHCDHCRARHACSAFLAVSDRLIDMAGSSVPHEMTPAAVAAHLRYLDVAMDRLKAMRDAREAEGMAMARTPAGLPGWTVGFGQGRETWTQPMTEVFALGEAFGVDLRKPPEAITPAQARKAGVDATVIAQYAKKPTGTARLVRADGTTAAKAFGG